MVFVFHWTFTLLILIFTQAEGDLKFAGWGKSCKILDSTGSDLPDPKDECDAGRGLTCQTYTQGKLCGCTGALSYDRRSEECRRKVGTMCHIPKDKEELRKLHFNRKCHEDAECVIYSGTLLGGEERKKDATVHPVCLCKHGFVSAVDFSECRDPNRSSLVQPSFWGLIGVSVLGILIQLLS